MWGPHTGIGRPGGRSVSGAAVLVEEKTKRNLLGGRPIGGIISGGGIGWGSTDPVGGARGSCIGEDFEGEALVHGVVCAPQPDQGAVAPMRVDGRHLADLLLEACREERKVAARSGLQEATRSRVIEDLRAALEEGD